MATTINHQLSKEYGKIELGSQEVKDQLLQDARYLHEKMSGLGHVAVPLGRDADAKREHHDHGEHPEHELDAAQVPDGVPGGVAVLADAHEAWDGDGLWDELYAACGGAQGAGHVQGEGVTNEPRVHDALNARELAAGFPGLLPGTALLLLPLSSANNYTWRSLDPASSQYSWIEIMWDGMTDGWRVDNAMLDEVPKRDNKAVGEVQAKLGTNEAHVETRPPSRPPLPEKGFHVDQSVTIAWKEIGGSIAWSSMNQHTVAIPMTKAKYHLICEKAASNEASLNLCQVEGRSRGFDGEMIGVASTRTKEERVGGTREKENKVE
ncbi:hypothetical protein JB92DRAFT_3096685 [Gautieria morchelliformis]|nr:hypothetical protein JB92DRAFT_3096685 [Gautieria morchelliformis]